MAESGALRELIAFLGFDVDAKPLEKADERLKGTLETAKRVAETFAALWAGNEIAEFIAGQIEMGAQLEHTSEMLGIGTDDLQAFQYAAATVGVDTEGATTALRFLNRTLGEAKSGNAEAAQAFAKMHVATKNADGSSRGMADTLADVANYFEKTTDPALRTAMAMKGTVALAVPPISTGLRPSMAVIGALTMDVTRPRTGGNPIREAMAKP